MKNLNMKSENQEKKNEFSKLRSFFWPIYNYELNKLIPMFFLFFLISFIYNLLRCIKISLIVTAPDSGAETIPFLKFCVVLPGAFVLIYIFTKLSKNYNRNTVFYIMISIYMAFFTLFLFVIYPNKEFFELKSISVFLLDSSFIPNGLSGLISLIRHWPLAIFYGLCELWGNIILCMLFWGFANEVTKINEAKRFYAIFALGANFSGIFSGQLGKYLTIYKYNTMIPFGNTAWEQTLFLQINTILLLGVIIIILYWWLNKNVYYDHEDTFIKEKKKDSISLKSCFLYLMQSSYLCFIVILVVSYNIVYNLSDVLFTHQAKTNFTDINHVNVYMNQITFFTGVLAVLSALFLSGNIIRRYGWTITAIITPIVWFMSSLFLFFLLFFEDMVLKGALSALFFNPANLILIFSSLQICLGRACKYTVFDETKEIAFIPLSKNEQRKGKAVVDGIASRIGKSGGSLIYLILLTLCGNLISTIPYVAVIIFIMIILWILSVINLGKMVNKTIDHEIKDAKVEDKPLIKL
jgi:AAA family ATP:ADP antiporter